MKKPGHKSAPGKDKKTTSRGQAQPQTWEDYMEEGVLLEEKGERYGTGEKAKRYYEKAGDMYNKACRLNPDDSDCLYNLGRVLYILVDLTPSATEKLKLLDASIERFRSAVSIDSDNVDTLYNLGQALTTHADLLLDGVEEDHDEDEDDEDDDDDDHKHVHGHGDPQERAAGELQEAIALFERCYVIQQKELNSAVKEAYSGKDSGSKSNADSVPKVLDEEEQQELSSSAGVLVETLISASQALTSLAFLVDTVVRSQKYYQQAEEKLDVALRIANDKLLWPASTESQSSKGKGKGVTVEVTDFDASDDIVPATRPVSTFREAEAKSEVVSQEEKLCDVHLQYSNLLTSQSNRFYQDTNQIPEAISKRALQHLNTVLTHRPRHVEALCDKGDLLGTWAQTLAATDKSSVSASDIEKSDSGSLDYGTSAVVAAEPSAKGDDKDTVSNKVWRLFASATRAFLSALDVEPQNTSILEKLGDIHWSRSQLKSAVAIKNRPMLLNNASVYYRFAWESCKEGADDMVDQDQRLEILMSWAQVLHKIPNKEEDVIRVLKQWKRLGGTMDLLDELMDDPHQEILQKEFIMFVMELLAKSK